MNFLHILHYAIIAFILFMPLYPINILKHIYYFPVIIPLLWVICGECPLTAAHGRNEARDSFTQSIYKKFYPDITEHRTDSINALILVSVVCLSTRKLIVKPHTHFGQIFKV